MVSDQHGWRSSKGEGTRKAMRREEALHTACWDLGFQIQFLYLNESECSMAFL